MANEDKTQPTLEYDANENSAPDAMKTRGEFIEALALLDLLDYETAWELQGKGQWVDYSQ